MLLVAGEYREIDEDPLMPERRLARAVLLMAISDYVCPSKCNEDADLGLIQTEAREFILSDSQAPYSFLWLCDHAMSDGADAVARIRKLCSRFNHCVYNPTMARRRGRRSMSGLAGGINETLAA